LVLGYSLDLLLSLGLFFSPLPIPPLLYIAAAAAAATPIMPTTPPPPSPPPPPPVNSPPTSPQLYQQAMRHQECLQRDRVSPELRRIPSTTSTALSNALPPPSLPSPSHVPAPVTFNGQTFNHLPAHIMAAMRNLQPLPSSSRRGHNTHPLPVSYLLFFLYSLSV